MTTVFPQTVRCSVCGAENEMMVVASTNTFGGTMDLDTRPPEMKRSTMRKEVLNGRKDRNDGIV